MNDRIFDVSISHVIKNRSGVSLFHHLGTSTEPVGPHARSEPQILVALPATAGAAVMPHMSTKSRQVIYGGRIIGAKMRAQGACARSIFGGGIMCGSVAVCGGSIRFPRKFCDRTLG